MEDDIQREELDVLESIYADIWKKEIDSDKSYSIEINQDVKLFITLNKGYPKDNPPSYQLLAPRLAKQTKLDVSRAFDDIYLDNIGEPVIFQWIEKLKEIIAESEVEQQFEVSDSENLNRASIDELSVETNSESSTSIKIVHGSTLSDRKSIFQGHVCEVNSLSDVKCAIDMLMENKKIESATHNMYAYVIKSENGISLQDCEDDGETHAGGRLLHLLQLLKVNNVLVVVSRWYGGVHLGPDRFRDINNAARQALVESGHIKSN